MNRILDQANYYKNLPLRDRSIKAVVHLEDTEDKNFWDLQLQNILPGKYHYISHSRSPKNMETTGCEQCLKFRPYLNNKFFICIDSDLRLLRHETGLISSNYIAQTHTYSWENHYCEGNYLQQRFDKLINLPTFDFRNFLEDLSEILYRPLLLLIHYQATAGNDIWNITKFNHCLHLQPSRKELEENGKEYIQKTQVRFDEAISGLTLPDGFQVEGLTHSNAYLHIQGHQLYKLVRYIGTLMCRGERVAFTSDILNTANQTSGYPEIDEVQYDLRHILKFTQ